MNTIRTLCLKLVLLFTALFFMGCSSFNPIGPLIQLGIYWVEGEAHKYYNTDQITIHRATKEALNELGIPVVSEQRDGGTIYMRAGDDDLFKIKIVATREKVTKLSIRVNTFGNKPYAELVYRHVDNRPGVIQFVTVDELNQAVQTRKRPVLQKL